MTLDQLRAELESGTRRDNGPTTLKPEALRDTSAPKLHRLATQRPRGTRMQLPHNQMPVLP